MRVGKNFSCNNGCVFSCVKGIIIGENCLFGGGITIRDSDGHQVYTVDAVGVLKPHPKEKEVNVGNHVWICNKCDILKGASIGSNCIISYGSLVTKPIDGDSLLIGGVPAKIIKGGITWEV